MDNESIISALKEVKYPGFSRDIVSFGLIQGVDFADGVASVSVEVTNADPKVPTQIKKSIEDTLNGIEGVDEVDVQLVWDPPWNHDMMSEAAKLELGMM